MVNSITNPNGLKLDDLGKLIDTPDNIDDLSDEQIAELCDSFGYIPKAESRVKFIRHFYKMLGFQISNDLLYALADEPKAMLMLAPAGGGKTTTVTAIIDCCKMLRKRKNKKPFNGDRVLSLVFNSANVPDMLKKHDEMTSKINRWELPAIPKLDYYLECRTFHGFCLKWIIECRGELGLDRYPSEARDITISQTLQTTLLQRAIESVCKKEGMQDIPSGLKPNTILNVRNFCVETRKTLEEIKDSDKVIDLGVDISVIQQIIDAYEKAKTFSRRLDNTDLLVLFHKLITTNEKVLNIIKDSYDLITADEFQDFTLLLREILYMIVGDDTQLICIGDDDQAIYGFRGADNNNALTFKDFFPNGKIHLLQTNRRCPNEVLDLAKTIIGSNEVRFPKRMKAIKEGGEIYYRPYNDRLAQYKSIVKELKTFSSDEIRSSVICYREKTPSVVLANLLYKENIPFYVNSGNGPFDYPLLNTVLSILKALQSYYDKHKLLDLYKIMPISRKELATAMGYDLVKRKFIDEDVKIDLETIPFPHNKMNNANFVKVYKFLIGVAKNLNVLPVREYVPTIIGLIKKYYFTYMISVSNADQFTTEFCEICCLDFFDTDFTFPELYAYYQKQRDELYKRQLNKDGVCLSTFHVLKGLEYDSVFVVDLCESIFPKFSLIDYKPYDDETKRDLKESETRLFYVVVTRSKRRLYLYYDKNDPSYYVSMLLGGQEGLVANEHKEENVIRISVPNSKKFTNYTSPVFREEKVVDVNEGVQHGDDIEIDLDNVNNEVVHEGVVHSQEVTHSQEVNNNQVIHNEQANSQVVHNQVVQPESNTTNIPNDDEVIIHAKPVNFRDNLINSLLKKNK